MDRGPLTSTERRTLGGLLLVGLCFPLFMPMWDSIPPVSVGLALLSVLLSFAVLRGGLRAVGARSDRLTPAALWGMLAWSVVPFAHTPFLGYLLVPFEILMGALFAAFRGGVPARRALVPVTLARLVSLVIPRYLRWLSIGAPGNFFL